MVPVERHGLPEDERGEEHVEEKSGVDIGPYVDRDAHDPCRDRHNRYEDEKRERSNIPQFSVGLQNGDSNSKRSHTICVLHTYLHLLCSMKRILVQR